MKNLFPVNLSGAYNRLRGRDLYLTHRYNLGFYTEETVDDTTHDRKVCTSIEYHPYTYVCRRSSPICQRVGTRDTTFFKNTYLTLGGTNEISGYWALSNTVGWRCTRDLTNMPKWASLLTPHMRYANTRKLPTPLHQVQQLAPNLSAHPDYNIAPQTTEHALWVGGQLWKRQGSWLTYESRWKSRTYKPCIGRHRYIGQHRNSYSSLERYAFDKSLCPV